MSTITELRDAIYERTGADVNHATRIDRALNRSVQEICSVMWDFLLTPATLTLLIGETRYYLPTDFLVLKEEELLYYDATITRRLLPGTPEMIANFILTEGTLGKPTRYALYGISSDVGHVNEHQIVIGCPIPSIDAAVDYFYWKKIPDYTALQTPIVSTLYNDIPIISGALWIYWKNLEQNDKAADAFNEFAGDMRVMQTKMSFTGNTHDQIIALRAAAQ
jgi:hypothetical protein